MTWHGAIFKDVHFFWKNIRRFCFYNHTIIEILFILLYTFEQLMLVWITYSYASNPQKLILLISILAIIILATFSFHKLTMESRIKVLEEELNQEYMIWHQEKNELENKLKTITREYNSLIEIINKNKGFK